MGVNMSKVQKQQGFVLLLFIVVVTIVASLWLSTKHERIISFFKTNQIDIDKAELKLVKERLLEYALLFPEIYMENASDDLQGTDKIPSPGYFPCPDTDGDGAPEGSCTNPLDPGAINPDKTGILPDLESIPTAFGYVPEGISTRNIYFAEKERYYYFLDERFSYQNGSYNTGGGPNRYAPLTQSQLDGEVGSAGSSEDPFEPALTLNGVTGYIALIIDSGDGELDGDNRDGDRDFTSRTDDLSDDPATDKIVGIKFNEWYFLMARRICSERPRIQGLNYDEDETDPVDSLADLTDIGNTAQHWFNRYDDVDNKNGGDWRLWGVICP